MPRIGDSGLHWERQEDGSVIITIYDADETAHTHTCSAEDFACGIFKVAHPDWKGPESEMARDLARRLHLGKDWKRRD